MHLTDTHAHLYADQFNNDREKMLQRAIAAGVTKFFLPNIDGASIDGMLAMVKAYPANCFPMMGLHPCSVNENYLAELEIVEQYLTEKKHDFCAVGEIGIDLYWDRTFLEQQRIALRKQVLLAKQFNLPIVIHTRNSFDETFEIISELNDTNLKGIFHCFSGNHEQANKVIGLGGFKMGIGGVATFKNGGLDTLLKDIELEHLVLETDSPYLAPAPHRGKRNESAYVVLVAQKLAAIKNISIEEVAEVTNRNSSAVFAV